MAGTTQVHGDELENSKRPARTLLERYVCGFGCALGLCADVSSRTISHYVSFCSPPSVLLTIVVDSKQEHKRSNIPQGNIDKIPKISNRQFIFYPGKMAAADTVAGFEWWIQRCVSDSCIEEKEVALSPRRREYPVEKNF